MTTDPSRTPWIFIRGLARHSGHWGPFIESFKKHFPNCEFELLDTRGNGTQHHIPSYTSIEENVRDLRSRSLLLKRGPVRLLTISLGSMIGIEWAHRFQQDIDALVCINTSDSKNSSFFERLRPSNYSHMLTFLKPGNSALDRELTLMKMLAPDFTMAEHWAKIFATMPATTHANLLRQLWAARGFQLPQQKPPCQVLLLASTNDSFVNSSCSQKIAKSWNHPCLWHPKVSHDIPLEDPDWVCQKIQSSFTM